MEYMNCRMAISLSQTAQACMRSRGRTSSSRPRSRGLVHNTSTVSLQREVVAPHLALRLLQPQPHAPSHAQPRLEQQPPAYRVEGVVTASPQPRLPSSQAVLVLTGQAAMTASPTLHSPSR